MSTELIMWIVFWIVITAALFIDLAILNKHHGKTTIKSAFAMVGCWVSLALLFCAAVYFTLGYKHALEFFTGYVLEYSLSMDNLFVFIMIFSYFAIAPANQPKVLLWGILGAVAMRFIFVFVGLGLVKAFSWTMILLGIVLIITAVKMLTSKDEKFEPEKNIAFRALKKIFPLKINYRGNAFFVKENGKLFATPLLAALCMIEMMDVVFAVDSVSAIFSISQDSFIVFSSNIFAVIGLRSLYFLLAGMAAKFPYLKYGISVILLFIGMKMIFIKYYHVPTAVSLGVIAVLLLTSIAASCVLPKKA